MSRKVAEAFYGEPPPAATPISLRIAGLNGTLGAARRVRYRSMKWEKESHDWIHDFGAGVRVIGPRADGSARSFPAIPDDLAWLGGVVLLEWIEPDGSIVQLEAEGEWDELPPLLAYQRRRGGADRATLIIGAPDGALAVRGGNLEVAARGIDG